eukprot:1156669-Pelagomonas_calceolata.AAC.3
MEGRHCRSTSTLVFWGVCSCRMIRRMRMAMHAARTPFLAIRGVTEAKVVPTPDKDSSLLGAPFAPLISIPSATSKTARCRLQASMLVQVHAEQSMCLQEVASNKERFQCNWTSAVGVPKGRGVHCLQG